MAKIYIYCSIVLAFTFLGCGGSPQPMPSDDSYKIPENTKPEPLEEAWRKKFALIKGHPGQKDLIDNITSLKKEHRDALLATLEVIPDQDQEVRFLQDFASFTKDQQAHLINIFLYLESRNKALILKLVGPERLTFIEKIKMLKLIHDLDQQGQDLIEEFEKKLEEDPE